MKIDKIKKHIPLKNYTKYSDNEIIEISEKFFEKMNTRRTVRTFSSVPIPIQVLKNAIKTANTSPSGANKQPWHFVLVKNAEVKRQIKIAAEKEESNFYNDKASEKWLKDLEPFETNEKKPFLEIAPYLIVVFEEKYKLLPNGEKAKNYYTRESVGLSCGILLTALHNVGLATLTHTPSPMNFLTKILNRPQNETPFLLIVVGYTEIGTVFPNIKRKKLNEILTII